MIKQNETKQKPQQNMDGGPMGGRGRISVGEKPKDFKKGLYKLIAYSRKYIPAVIIALILSGMAVMFSLIGPNKLSEMTNLITHGMNSTIDTHEIVKIAMFLMSIYTLSLIFGYAQAFIMTTVSQRISKTLRRDIVLKLNKLPLSYFDTRTYGDILSRVTNDVDTIGTSLNQSLSSVISGILTFVGSLVLMLWTNWAMAIGGFIATWVGFMLMGMIIKNSQKFFRQQQAQLGILNGHIEETFTGHTVIKAYNAEAQEINTFEQMNNTLFLSAWKAQYISRLMMPVMGFVGNLSYVVVCIIGAFLVLEGKTEFGTIVAFMVYIRLFTQPLSTLAQAATTLQSAVASSERVFALLEEEELSPEISDQKLEATIKGNITFKNIEFGYNKDKIIIKNFSATIKAGQKVAVVGPTGAGKTTLVNLLMRFYELNAGEILLDGIPISKITREQLRSIFAMVLQDTWLFEGTIKQNIAYNKTDVTDEQIINACKSVGIHHMIKTLPKGYDTVLSQATMSVGEKQLLTIARAMVKNAELLILDEATSSVDTRTELLIQKAMDNLSEGKTSFIIAHRLSTIRNADIILVMKDGNIIESGGHAELLEKNGFYADLYNSQFEVA
ncbi:ABC transporter [Candidatus Epulonipiscium fishelsonii]|uniref:ABC transporter n=1 Tax=Candidatus Epulonipiscium fishelsonii TaxID=77094 RepID=A0ACC8XHG4_9FIRM|nr:ABC transporter [Epulopiscium sp. SCG-B05WGA-EpuloA1]ONI43018.1 ABC transporter [Epulopiscium sp. SCG-B11WGA-EpuloA1]